jgi:hypothetical protein
MVANLAGSDNHDPQEITSLGREEKDLPDAGANCKFREITQLSKKSTSSIYQQAIYCIGGRGNLDGRANSGCLLQRDGLKVRLLGTGPETINNYSQ